MTKLACDSPLPQFKDWRFEPGCYVDGARGIYAIDAIAARAEAMGLRMQDCSCESCGNPVNDSLAGCEFAGELEDEIDEYMNRNFPVAGHSWGRSEQGDWGLWAIEEE